MRKDPLLAKVGDKQTIRVSFSNPLNGPLRFQLGDAAGTNNASIDINLTVNGTFGANTPDVIKSISKMDCFEIESIKVSGSAPPIPLFSGLKIQKTDFNSNPSFILFDTADFADQFQSNDDFIEWKSINWPFAPADIIEGFVQGTVGATTSLTLLIVFKRVK